MAITKFNLEERERREKEKKRATPCEESLV
jgi:hypothetical protein